MARPRLVHVTTADISLDLLLGPQLRAFADAGYEVYGASAPGPHVPQVEGWGAHHVALAHATRASNPGRDVAAGYELFRLFRRVRPDIVHTHNPKTGLLGRIAGRAARVPAIVNTVHGLYALPDDPVLKRGVVYTLERIAAACSDMELVQNPEDLETLAGLRVPRRRLRLLGNGIDLDRFPSRDAAAARARLRASWGVGDDDVVCGTVGRLVWEKGFRELFGAVEQLSPQLPQLRVVVAGPPDPAKSDAVPPEAIDRARDRGVQFLGMRDDIEEIYAAMDVFVLASHREGFPRAAMEAAASGLPIVATDIRGCRQVVDDGMTGLLVPVRQPDALAEAIGQLVRDHDARARMGAAAGKKAIAEFDQRRVIETSLEVYDQLLHRGRGVRTRR